MVVYVIHPWTNVRVYAARMMNVNRFVVLSKSVHIGQRLLAGNARHAGKEVLHLRQRRSFKTHPRNLAYAKDLFLGQVNKVTVTIVL